MTTHHHFNASAAECRLTFLTGRKGIADFLKLHESVYWSLAHNKRHFLKKRGYHDLMRHLLGGHHIIAMYTPDNVMVAQGLVTFADTAGASNLAGYPVLPGSAVIQSVGVHPKANGQGAGYVDALLKGAEAVIEGAQCTQVLAKMSVCNKRSKSAFERAGFSQFGDETQVAGEAYVSRFMHKKVTPQAPVFMPVGIQTQFGALTA